MKKLMSITFLLLTLTLFNFLPEKMYTGNEAKAGIILQAQAAEDSDSAAMVVQEVVQAAQTQASENVSAPAPEIPAEGDLPWWVYAGPLIVGFLEVIMRVIPSSQNMSIFAFLYNIFSIFVKNKDASTGREYKIKKE